MARIRTTKPTRPPAPRNFHLPLPEDLHEALARAAHERGRPATEIARAAIREWLEARRREAVSDQLATYARAAAGSAADLDEALERGAVEHLRGRPRRGRRR
jgi:predicted transcriptional regulator